MKKLMILVTISLIVLACKKERKEKVEVNLYTDSQAIGKWVYDSLKVNGVSSKYQHQANCNKDRFFMVNLPGQEYYYSEDIYENENCYGTTTGMNWRLKGENLILSFGTQDFIYRILRLTETNFDVSISVDYDGDGKKDQVEIHAIREKCMKFNDPYCQ